MSERWSGPRANEWYARQPWLVGANYVPSDAINQLVMFQAATWNAELNKRELGYAARLGMNTVRVFLHDLLREDEGFLSRLDGFLAIAAGYGIRVMLVLFDSCWDPRPKLGPQHPPIPGVHNSGWVQSPGATGLRGDEARLREYVVGVVGAFKDDERVLAWDVWNEPDNVMREYADTEPADKVALVNALLPQVFAWVREVGPMQPLTSPVWHGTDGETARIQLEESDVITFHDYGWPEQFEGRIDELERLSRPVLCTEYLARGAGSTVDGCLPVGHRRNVAMYAWGLVDGATQTRLPWDSWQRPYVLSQPMVWHHDLLHRDGSAYREREAEVMRELARRGKPSATLGLL